MRVSHAISFCFLRVSPGYCKHIAEKGLHPNLSCPSCESCHNRLTPSPYLESSRTFRISESAPATPGTEQTPSRLFRSFVAVGAVEPRLGHGDDAEVQGSIVLGQHRNRDFVLRDDGFVRDPIVGRLGIKRTQTQAISFSWRDPGSCAPEDQPSASARFIRWIASSISSVLLKPITTQ